MRTTARLAVLLCGLSPWAWSQASPAKAASGRVLTTTRLVALFSDLETRWLKAIEQRDTGALDRMLGEDFEVWTPAPPGAPIPRDDWQKNAFAQHLASYHIRQMAVRSVSEDAAVVSFVLATRVEGNGTSTDESYFVVDLWENEDGKWKCTDRYLSRTEPSANTQVRPTGKR